MKIQYKSICICLLAILLAVGFTILPNPSIVEADSPVVVSVAASDDDCLVYLLDTTTWTLGKAGTQGIIGYIDATHYAHGLGLRFLDVDIPAGATITSAYITLHARYSDATTEVASGICAELNASPATFSDIANYQSRRGTDCGGANNNNRTVARVDWNPIETWVGNTHYNSPDIKTVIQEMVDTVGALEHIVIFFDDHDDRTPHTAQKQRRPAMWDDPTYDAAELTITYEASTPPTLTMDNVTLYGDTWAFFSGNITDTGGENAYTWGFQWKKETDPYFTNNQTFTGSQGVGQFTHNATGLEPGTLYVARSFAANTAGYGYSEEGDYIGPPVISTQAATNIGSITATLNANLTDTGGQDCTLTLFWGTVNGGESPASWAYNSAPTSPAQPQSTGVAYKNATNLPGGSTIYFNVRAVNDSYTSWGTPMSFLTKPTKPTGVSATDGNSTSNVTINWTKSTGADAYTIWRDSTNVTAVGDVAVYEDIGADAPTITAGTASAADGVSPNHVTLSIAGESANDGTTHNYKVQAHNATGSSSNSTADAGYIGPGPLLIQWQRSDADSDADYSNIDGATTDPYNDTGGVLTPDGRYYKPVLNAAGAVEQEGNTDRGYKSNPSHYLEIPEFVNLLFALLIIYVLCLVGYELVIKRSRFDNKI